MRFLILAAACSVVTATAFAQASPQFEVVSIKRVTELRQTASIRTMPDGTEVIVNVPVAGFVGNASPVKVREVFGLPEWASTEKFDLTAKPPAGSSKEQRQAMWRAMFADRMKLAGHVEQRERDVYVLVMARADRRLGPAMKASTLDCAPRPETPPTPGATVRFKDLKSRCGYGKNGTSIVSGGVSMDTLAEALDSEVDADVENRTGLQGWYVVDLTYAPPLRITGAAADAERASGDLPDIFTAV
jgi:uncharacterized protein (TIGR03435 family)